MLYESCDLGLLLRGFCDYCEKLRRARSSQGRRRRKEREEFYVGRVEGRTELDGLVISTVAQQCAEYKYEYK